MGYNSFLKRNIEYVIYLNYTIAVLIILIATIKSIIAYIEYYKYGTTASSTVSRLILGESIALALSFILSVEILRFFYIKNYQQLIIISGLVFLKLLSSIGDSRRQ